MFVISARWLIHVILYNEMKKSCFFYLFFYSFVDELNFIYMKKFTFKTFFLTAGLALSATALHAQQIRDGYVDYGKNTGSEKFHLLMLNWRPGQKVSVDDNFFISRVKPRARFRNKATQVRMNLTTANDKKLLAWIPVNEPAFNALPDGVFDSEVFTMWPYVTHWGDWTASLGRIPAAFLDVAHKNGVAVSGVASIPNAGLEGNWFQMIKGLGTADAKNVAEFLHYYGIDGLGYNSEFYDNSGSTEDLRDFHAKLVKESKPLNPLFENIWYDGTNDDGNISFDNGLGGHNAETFGDKDNVRTSLFFNYNWNREGLLARSATYAQNLGRSPLDLYAGINMQGGTPRNLPWSLLEQNPISIGLWGAHSNNMFWESRGELGSSPEAKQNTYLLRTERYFTGGTRNPANCPPVRNGHQYNANNFNWHGMSTFMSARSSLSWNLAEEPFITHFNLGNGKFFNLDGVRKNNNSWYNVGIQDYLPTWHFWFASKLLGRTAADVPSKGLDANFTWDDAYFGGSSLRVTGTSQDEYLHLFKTKYTLKSGDVVTVRYKLNGGSADMQLVLSAEGSENTGVSYTLGSASDVADELKWTEKTFKIGSDFDGKDLALVALHFKNAKNLNLLLGEFSVVRGTSHKPEMPEITDAKMLHNSKEGMDAKVIFNMANDKPAGTPCYNVDVKTSYFRLYAQEENQEPVLMGATSSWAGLYYSIHVKKPNAKVRLGVSAVSLDQKTESDIAWSNYLEPSKYVYDDAVQIDKNTIKPGEKFTVSYVDPQHPAAQWEIVNVHGATVKSGNGNSWTVDGLDEIGSYDLKVTGAEYKEDGTSSTSTRTLASFVQITGTSTGALPEIHSLTANGGTNDVSLKVGENVKMAYTGRSADGSGSQGVNLKENAFGFNAADLGVTQNKSFSVTFWLKLNKLAGGETQLLNIRSKRDGWPKTDWGWLWSNVKSDGSIGSFTWRGTDRTSNRELRYQFANTKLPIGAWVHIAYVFDYNANGDFRGDFYVNGKKQELTGWNRSTDGNTYRHTDPGYQQEVYGITSGMMVAIGGDAAFRSGIDGAIDNFCVWDGAIDANTVKKSMGDFDKSNLPTNLKALWDIETKAGGDHHFAAMGSASEAKAGIYEYVASGEGEGMANINWVEPVYMVGCPFVSGQTYKVETTPSWSAKNATVTNSKGNGEAGSADVAFRVGGDYSVTLTLSNALGRAVKTFSVIKVERTMGLKHFEGAQMKAYAVDGNAIIEFDEAGSYEVTVFDVSGKLMARKEAKMLPGNVMNVGLGAKGAYLLRIKKDGMFVKTVKLLNK